MNLHLREWWFNFDEDGFLSYWQGLPWRCRIGRHKQIEVDYGDMQPDHAIICERCEKWYGWI